MAIRVFYEQHGEPGEVLRAEEYSVFEPGPDQVLIKVEAAPINPSDLATVRGVYRTPQKLPTTPGYEGVGRLVKLGKNIKTLEMNQRVLIPSLGRPGWQNGTWQQFVCKDEDQVFPIPENGDLHTWAQFFITVLTAWVMSVEELALKSGDSLLVTGAGSTVGQVIFQIAKLMGFSVLGVVRRPEQVGFIRELGAEHVICSATEDIGQRCMALTQLKGVTAVVDSVGGKVATQCFRGLKDRGQMLIYGLLDQEVEADFDVRKMLFYNLSLRGFWITDWWINTPVDRRLRVVNTVIDLVSSGKLVAPVEAIFGIEEVKAAVERSEKTGNNGRVILQL